MLTSIVEKLKTSFPDSITVVQEFRGETTVHVKKDSIVSVCLHLRDDASSLFDYCSDVCGADAYTPENRFEVIYNLYSTSLNHRIRIKTFVDETDMHCPSVISVWPGANWPERETFDMFGIIFDGHNDLRRMYMPEEFEYHPLRKDFPMMGIPDSIPLPRK
ncbi:MAG: NADH-quinone oxidoreductase subunit C [Bacteriovoracaceae bacterium]|nr:NADH-quinone oxidoreductase subunit C [Bacteroidota bacterium]